MGLTRRDFIARVGQAGGYGAAFATMQSLGLLPMKAEMAAPIYAEPGSGNGVKLVVLGGGIAGLVTAYEARKLGYDVTLLEARDRPGGRNWSGRNGSVIEFVDGTRQPIEWSDGLYQNLGPARLPSVHGTMLGYCRELKVPLEVEVNTSRSTLLQNDKVNSGKPYQQRKAINDTRGQVSELLAKSVSGGALDQQLTASDKERMMAFLTYYGPLDKTGRYIGSDRSQITQYPGAGAQDMVVDRDVLSMQTLLDANFWSAELYEEAWDWQATMFQPVGGMDRIPYAFAKSLGPIVHYNSPVTEIEKTATGVTITYSQGGASKTISADFCVCSMPLTILKHTRNNFDAAHADVIARAAYQASFKIPWESRRFWEQDYNIYGGLSFLSQGPSPVWYPSANMFSDRGIVVSGYMDERSAGFTTRTLPEMFDISRMQIEKLHPGHGRELEKPVFCGWRRIKYNEGSWIGTQAPADYAVITQPDGPVYFAGDHTSHVVGWQEGAALSGKRAVQMIADKVKSAKLATKQPFVSA